jgi:hypothetical protein
MKQTKFAFRDVIDATKDLTLVVTNKDIMKANLKSPSNCAAARACRRQTGHEARIHISRVYIKENGGDIWVRYITSHNLRDEIISFDRGGSFLPGTFHLRRPEPSRKLGSDKRSRFKHKKVRGKGKGKYTMVKDVRTGPANGI